jgi:hypothetical protein
MAAGLVEDLGVEEGAPSADKLPQGDVLERPVAAEAQGAEKVEQTGGGGRPWVYRLWGQQFR